MSSAFQKSSITVPVAIADGGTEATTASGARTSLGLAIGTNVQAYDAELSAIAGLTSAADKLPYFTGAGTAATTDLTTFGRSLIDDAAASNARTTLGLTIGTNVQAQNAGLQQVADLADPNADRILFWDDSAGAYTFLTAGSGLSIAGTTITATGGGTGTVDTANSPNANEFARFTDADTIEGRTVAEAKADLDLEVGTDLQAYSANLDEYAAVNPTAAGLALLDDADAAAQRTTLGLGTIATQDANNVTISGGAITGITDLAVADGGTGASTLTGILKGNGTSAFTAVTAPSGAIVGDTDSQTLTNKTLTSPAISTISNTGTLTLPTSTDTLVGRATTDTLTNKTLGATTMSGTLTFAANNIATLGNTAVDGTATRDITMGRQSSGAGSNLTVQAGGALNGGTDLNGGTLILASGIAVGNNSSQIQLQTVPNGQGAGTTDRSPLSVLYLSSTGTNNTRARLGLGTNGVGSADGISMSGNSAYQLAMNRHTTNNTAGNSLTIQSGGATSGATDKAAGDLILTTGLSTGVGRSKVRIQTNDIQPGVTTGTTNTTATDRIIVVSPKIITNNSATGVVDIALATLQQTGGMIHWTVESTDGTDMQAVSGVAIYSAVNKGGVYTTSITSATGGTADDTTASKSVSAGTITTTWTITTGTNKVTLNMNANSSKTSTGYPRVTFTLTNLGQTAPTIL